MHSRRRNPDKLLHRWKFRSLHVHARGGAAAIERTDLFIHASWSGEAVSPHDEVNFCAESVSGVQSVDGAIRDINT